MRRRRSCAGRGERGLERRQLEGLKHLGMDEKSFKRGQSYITLLTDLEQSRVVDVVEERTTAHRESRPHRQAMACAHRRADRLRSTTRFTGAEGRVRSRRESDCERNLP